ncbi:MAG: endopeptidase La [Verrucomicrobiota bacterium]|nr:endopeptidase La [Verrucomicrobiota bacterium]
MSGKPNADSLKDVEVVREPAGPASADEKKIVPAREVLPSQLPIVPVNNRPVFPKMTVPIVIDDDNLKKLLADAVKDQNKFVGLLLKKETKDSEKPEAASPANLYSVGVAAEILQMAQAGPGGPIQVLLGVMERIKVVCFIRDAPYLVAKVKCLYETEMAANAELKAYSISVIQSIKELVKLDPLHKAELGIFLSHSNLSDPGRLADFAAALTTAGAKDLQDVLETLSIRARLAKVLVLLHKEIDVSKIQMQINKQIEEKLSRQQREFFLREQLKAIKKELGLAKEDRETEVERFQKRIEKLALTDEARERIAEELDKLKLLEPSSPEFNVTRNYLDWLTVLPWGVFTKDSYDIAKAARILDHDHYGLADVKERILEFLSVGIMKGNIAGSILCFVGPPGVGKTSVGQSIARSVGRNFFRFSLGGIRDEAEIKGHRRTYIGALPGKFIQTMKVCRSANPVIMLDEIDKINASYQGDPASALLEVLDPEQNKDFLDHYFDVRFDLSNVLFICTANTLDTIPRPLLDRMEVIKLPGYIQQEKTQIARRHLIPKQLKAHGLSREQFNITPRALREMIDGYAREPGVRGLENHLKKIMRRSVKQIVQKKTRASRVDVKDLEALLGRRIFTEDVYAGKRVPGVVMGLAWTTLGGDTLYVEATSVRADKPGFKQTGQLGGVMVESAEIAYTYVRSLLEGDAKAREFFEKRLIHLHVPAGATPKDGPSAGITMAVALYSLALGIPARGNMAMTGELTLTGQVMPIGGVKEKTIAAKRAGVARLIFPDANCGDFEEVPARIKKGLTLHFVKTFPEAAAICFPEPARDPASKGPRGVLRRPLRTRV